MGKLNIFPYSSIYPASPPEASALRVSLGTGVIKEKEAGMVPTFTNLTE